MTSNWSDLNVRLREVPEHVLRQIIQSICLQNNSVERLVLHQLDRYDAIRPAKAARTAKSAEVSAAEHTAGKRKAGDSATLVCANCKNIYSGADNSDTACSRHTGSLDWDPEFFPDNYEGDPDPVFEDDPEGFYWTCCGERGDVGNGCIKGKHVPLAAKRRKWWDEE